jgi:DNA polymerase delta subunit 1
MQDYVDFDCSTENGNGSDDEHDDGCDDDDDTDELVEMLDRMSNAVDVESDGCGGRPSPEKKKPRLESMPPSHTMPPPPMHDYALKFIGYARPQPTIGTDAVEFMLVDAENVTSRIRPDMDDPSVEHFATAPPADLLDCEGGVRRGMYGKRPRPSEEEEDGCRQPSRDRFVLGPVVKLYGVCDDETSLCIDVYGHYPSFRLQIVRGTPSERCMERVRTYIEEKVLNQQQQQSGGWSTARNRARNVVRGSMARAFSAFPYAPEPSTFFEYRLARAQHVRVLADHFLKTPLMEDAQSAGGVIGFVPHSGEDVLTQYMVGSGISGFGWVSAARIADPHDAARTETDLCTCGRVGDCGARTVRCLEDRDAIAPLRVMGIDIECLKDEGMPDPHRNPVIIIGVIVCTAVNGVVDPQTLRHMLFAWFAPGSGGIADVEGAHHTTVVDSEVEMLVAFGAFLTAYDPDIYVGHNIAGFDIPYLVTRANVLDVQEVMYMGRRRERAWYAPREIIRVRKNGDTRKSLRVDTPGRIQLDTLPFIQNMKKESSYGLGALARKYLGEGKDDVGYQMIAPLWRQSRETRARLCAYCLKDVRLSLGLATAKDFEMILSVVELSRGTRVRAAQLLRSGNQEKVKTLVLNQAKDPRFDPQNLPVFFPHEKPRTRAKDDKFQGATVISPRRGARGKDTPVAVGDFSSLYPSIMLAHNLCV